MVTRIAQFQGILTIPLIYNSHPPIFSGSTNQGGFVPGGASSPAYIRNFIDANGKTQWVNAYRYNSLQPDSGFNYQFETNPIPSGFASGSANLSHNPVLINSYLFNIRGDVAKFSGQASYVNQSVTYGPMTFPSNIPFNLAAATTNNQNGVYEAALLNIPYALVIQVSSGFVPIMSIWNPTVSILPFAAGFDPAGHKSAAAGFENALGNVPDYGAGLNYTLYVDNQGNTPFATSNFYISTWRFNISTLLFAPAITELLFQTIAWSDPNLNSSFLHYQKIWSVTGGFVFQLRSPYTFNGVQYFHLFLAKDGLTYYLMKPQWLFTPSTIRPGDTTVLSPATTVGFARDKRGIWYGSVQSLDITVNWVGTSFSRQPLITQLYNPQNISARGLSCINPCNTFPTF